MESEAHGDVESHAPGPEMWSLEDCRRGTSQRFGGSGSRAIAEPHPTARGHLEQSHDPHERGFAGSIRPQDAEDLTLAESDAIDRQGESVPVADFQVFAEKDVGAHPTILCTGRRYGQSVR